MKYLKTFEEFLNESVTNTERKLIKSIEDQYNLLIKKGKNIKADDVISNWLDADEGEPFDSEDLYDLTEDDLKELLKDLKSIK
jgi:hypothetical protein